MKELENQLDKLFGKKGPVQLPENAKKTLVEWLPWINVVFGVLQLWAAWALWQLGHALNNFVNYTNTLSQVYGTGQVVNQLDTFYWVSLIVLVLDAVLILAAFPGLKARSKAKGWNLLFYATLVNLAYGVVRLFTSIGSGPGSLVGSVIGAAIAFFFLFQVRDYYNGHKAKTEDKK
jgi:hypothetical protein